MNNTTSHSERTYIIIEPDPIVGLDLNGILSSAFPDAALKLFRDIAEAEAHIATAMSSACILLNSKVASCGILELLNDCVGRGVNVLFIGETRDVGFPASFVQKPFTSDMILTTLTGFTPDGGS